MDEKEIVVGIKPGFKRKRPKNDQIIEPIHKIQKLEVNSELRKKYKIKVFFFFFDFNFLLKDFRNC